jgi:hypothetical protein
MGYVVGPFDAMRSALMVGALPESDPCVADQGEHFVNGQTFGVFLAHGSSVTDG